MRLQVLINHGDGSFRDETASRVSASVRQDLGSPFARIDFVDINGDGFPDILTQPTGNVATPDLHQPLLRALQRSASCVPARRGPYAWVDAQDLGCEICCTFSRRSRPAAAPCCSASPGRRSCRGYRHSSRRRQIYPVQFDSRGAMTGAPSVTGSTAHRCHIASGRFRQDVQWTQLHRQEPRQLGRVLLGRSEEQGGSESPDENRRRSGSAGLMGAAPGPGDEIGGFRLVKLIGRGAFGSVFEAEELRGLGRRVAVKVLAGGLAGRRTLPQAIRRRDACPCGGRAASARRAPLWAGEDRGVLYIAMRLVESDLRAVLRESGRLPPQLVATRRRPGRRALDYAHSLGFVHRDVKPANVLFGQPGGRPHCYVTDFGIASAPEPADSTTGGLGGPRGTYAYMAPETIEARPSRDGQGDGYSLACVAHECLCGSAFFQRASEPATMMAQLKETPPPLASELGLVAGVDAVLARELEKDPSRRFGRARASPRRWRRSSRAHRGLAAVVAVALAVGLGSSSRWRGSQPSSPAVEVERSGTLPRWGRLRSRRRSRRQHRPSPV